MANFTDPETGLPADENGNVLSAEAAGSDTLAPTPSVDPLAAAHQDLAPFIQGGEIEMPAMDLRAGRGPAPLVGGGAGASVGYRGLTGEGEKRAAGTRSTIDQKVADYDATDTARLREQEAVSGRDYAAQKAANDQAAAAEHQYNGSMAEVHARLGALNKEYARQERENALKAKEAGAEFVSNYSQQLAAVRQMTVNPVGPIAELDPVQMGGLTMATFAQGFLAARGIKIDVTGQIDNYVQRSIHEQERRIGQAEKSAQDSLSLWHLARQNSADDWEARQRYRGFVIEGMKAGNEVLMSRFRSQLANAHAAELNAKLDTEQHNTAFTLRDRHEQRVLEMRKYYSDEAYKAGMLHIEELKARAEMSRASAAQAKTGPQPLLIDDPSRVIRGTTGSDGQFREDPNGKETRHPVIAYVDPNEVGAGEAANKIRAARQGFAEVNTLITDTIRKRKEALSEGQSHPLLGAISEIAAPGAYQSMRNPTKREYDQMVTELAMKMTKATFGARSSDQEQELVRSIMPYEKWLQSGSNDNEWLQLRKHVADEYNSNVGSYAKPLAPGAKLTVPTTEVNPQAQAAYDISQKKAGAPENQPVKQFGKQEVDLVNDLSSANAGGGVGVRVSTRGGQLTHPGGFFDAAEQKAVAPSSVYSAFDRKADSQPPWAVAMDHLALAMVAPKSLRLSVSGSDDALGPVGIMPDDDRLLASEGRQGLERLAAGKNRDVASYAEFLLKQYASDPAALRDAMDPWAK